MTALRAAALLLTFAVSAAGANVEIVAPTETLHDADVRIRVNGLEPGTTVELQSDFVTRGGTVWRSSATFVADASGAVDPATAVPVSGSWQTADPHAFIWSAVKTEEKASDPSLFENDDRSVVTVRVRQQTNTLAEKQLVLLKRAHGISTTEIRGPVIGTFMTPYGKRSLPAVIVLGGSEGGINREKAALVASHGYAVLAVAYFGIGPLPELLEHIPVETVDRAVEWLKGQPAVDASRIAIVGGSKGAELALLAASRNPSIRAVVAIAPASVVFQSVTFGRGHLSSSWTIGGKEVPYAPYVLDAYGKSRRGIDLYTPTLAGAPAEAVIPVEKIVGPILLLAGKEDALWPSATMAEQIVARAKQKGFRYPVINMTMEAAGHNVAGTPNRPTADFVRLGGTPQGLAEAHAKSAQAIIDFLDRSIGAGSKNAAKPKVN